MYPVLAGLCSDPVHFRSEPDVDRHGVGSCEGLKPFAGTRRMSLCEYAVKSAGSDQVSLLHDLQGHPTEGSAAVEGHQTVDDRGRKGH